MKNTLTIDGYQAVIQYDPDIDMFRGEFVGLNGGADFYAKSIQGLRREGRLSLKTFLDACKKRGVEPCKSFSGKFNVRIPPELHESLTIAAGAENRSLNDIVVERLKDFGK